ncbi:MAG: acetyl-CoA C-acyltransferase [Candidatus Dormibacteraeota bacterium]|uniref:acetyl-CoA C-acetyltransferase n=1 Tax=Candidatus Amunia macphersoniae TaxID=3127014 RepID=A0A934NE96_9BACT|nr:acetyl-CoA C-acyltransferase [Candidatus Dormibacteraeota bacterium]
MNDVVIVSAARTPFGKLGGGLSGVPAIDLGARVIREVLDRTGTDGNDVDQLIMGTVLAGGQGQVPSRQAGLKAGLPPSVPSFTVNKVCASALKAVNLGALLISSGEAEVVVAGGMESMSLAPYLLEHERFGARLGDRTTVDSIYRDGLCCPADGLLMGVHGSEVAAELGVSREQQDEWALRSQQRYAAALASGRFAEEIVPVEVKAGAVVRDEQPRPETSLEKLTALPAAFGEGSTVTAGNAPGINDGASAVLLMSGERARAAGLAPLGTWVTYAESAADHPYLATVPAIAVDKALARTRGEVDAGRLDVIEINEAFAAVAITSTRMLEVDPERVNVNGGAIAVGHPIGASGARILMTLLYELRRRGGGYGAAGICSGMAQGEATLVRVG